MGAAPQYVAWASNLGVSHTLNVHFAVKSSGCISRRMGDFMEFREEITCMKMDFSWKQVSTNST